MTKDLLEKPEGKLQFKFQKEIRTVVLLLITMAVCHLGCAVSSVEILVFLFGVWSWSIAIPLNSAFELSMVLLFALFFWRLGHMGGWVDSKFF